MSLLDGRVAVVTGAGRGVGAAIARGLAAEGCRVVVNDLGVSLDGTDPDVGPARDVADEISASGGTALLSTADVTDGPAVAGVIADAVSAWGRLDIVVNVAGILRDRMIFNMTETEWDAVIAVHMKGAFNTIRGAAAHWRDHPSSANRLINITSTAGLFGAPGMPNYSAAKMGIIGMTSWCARHLGRYGVVATGLMPRAATRMTDSMPDEKASAVGVDKTGATRDPKNVADATVYLAGDEAAWANGRIFGVGAGRLTVYSNLLISREIAGVKPGDAAGLAARLGAFRDAVEHRGFFDAMAS
jgi:NAD(P)-dependent dehydrogenase (short-subunit alcohol dehydrogenase family)